VAAVVEASTAGTEQLLLLYEPENNDNEGVCSCRHLQHAHYIMLYTDIERCMVLQLAQCIVLYYAQCIVLHSAAQCA
jgi:hypothetical protein